MEDVTTSDQVRKNLAANLRWVMQDRGLTQAELAQRSGLSQTAISLILNGLRTPKVDLLVRIAEALHVSMDRLCATPPEEFSVPTT